VIAGPDYPDRGGAGLAVVTGQVAAYGPDKAAVGGLVASERLG
jgi:hypothetical protein